jgi:hypothetical protein
MAWSPAARAAAAAARKRNRPAAARATPLTQRTNTQRNRLMGLADTASAKGRRQVRAAKRATATPRTQPHKAIPNTTVSHSLAAPMKSPGVANPTGPQAFTHRPAGGKLPNSRMSPTTQARNYKSKAKSPRTPVIAAKKKYPSSKIGAKPGRKPKGGSAYSNPGYGNPYYHG